MIFTVTLNPALDYEIEISNFNLNKLNRAEKQSFIPGGKGINVSRGLSFLGVDSIATGFLGGFTGHLMLEKLKKEKFQSRFITIHEPTRLNIKVQDQQHATEINGVSPSISATDIESLWMILDELKDGDILILSGSQPQVKENIYKKILERYQRLNLNIILDISGQEYHDLLRFNPLMIKPNTQELKDYTKSELMSEKDILQACRKILSKGSQSIIVSLGYNGAYYMDQTYTCYIHPIKGTPIRSYGAGDHLVSGFIYGLIKNENTMNRLRYGVACASLHIFEQNGYNLKQVEELVQHIEIEEIVHD